VQSIMTLSAKIVPRWVKVQERYKCKRI